MSIISQKRFINEALKAHNEYRAKHQVPNLELDSKLSEFACEWAEKLALEESLKYEDGQYLNEPIGENILRVKLTKKLYFSGEEATEEWYKGSAAYNYDGKFTEVIGNFTQLVWKNSKKFGFGFALSEDGYFYAVANYYPAGNYRNQFNENVFPADDISSWFEYFRLFKSFKNEPNSKAETKLPEKTVQMEAKASVVTPKMVFNESVNEFGPVQNRFIMEALKTHNDCRARHGVAPLKHNREISKIAQAYALKLARLKALKHSAKESRIYNAESLGENLAFSYDSRLDFYSGEKATMQWYDEIKDHHFDSDSQPGTGHFTQLVWKNSKEVGFGVAKANDGSFYAVANYYPAGNMIGRFVPNVPRPVN